MSGYPHLSRYISSLVAVPAGVFEMGGAGYRDERPVHPVTLCAYRIGRTPVTVAMWREYCQAADERMPEAPDWGWIDDNPIVNVSWVDCQGYLEWASEASGLALSLPTEAQWEYAARGPEGRLYPWGTEKDGRRCVNVHTHPGGTAPVGSKPKGASWCGALDMAGNVWEWCQDWYGSDYYATPAATQPDPTGPESGEDRVARGGSWDGFDPDFYRGAFRGMAPPLRRATNQGFRLAAPAKGHVPLPRRLGWGKTKER